jgi:DNA repair protein RadC
LQPDAATIHILHMSADALPVEKLRVLHLDAGGTLVGITEHSDNLPGRVAVPVRRIVADALACDATTLILSHNHPGGDPLPSRADIVATHHLIRAVTALGIRVHDHVVTGDGRDFSFRAAGLI